MFSSCWPQWLKRRKPDELPAIIPPDVEPCWVKPRPFVSPSEASKETQRGDKELAKPGSHDGNQGEKTPVEMSALEEVDGWDDVTDDVGQEEDDWEGEEAQKGEAVFGA